MGEEREDRSGYGDDQGTRVGRPEHGRAGSEPGEYPGVPERDGASESGRGAERGSGEPGSGGGGNGAPRNAMGSEAAEGIHGAREGGRDAAAPSSLGETGTGRERGEGAQRSGSEPLVERERVADSSYGGDGGDPRETPDRPH